MSIKPPDSQVVTPALEVKDLRTQFFTDEGVVKAVDGVSFTVAAGDALGIVGESGSGKSVTALSLMRLLDEPSRIVGGEIRFQGKDVLKASDEELRNLRGDRIAMVFQDPMTSLNPVIKIAKQLIETMVVHGRYTPEQAGQRAVNLLGRMGVSAPERAIDSYPHQFSGGMRQRVMLALGMSNEPALLIADEPTTALDVTIQAQILDLLRELNRDFGTAIVLISHDLGVIARVCTRTIVMYGGEVVEEGPTEDLLKDPRHPYTWALINAVPRIDETTSGDRRLTTIEGQPPDPLNMPAGCRFAPRCPFRVARCDEHPELGEVLPGRKARCWVTQGGETLELKQRVAAAAAGSARREGPKHDGAPILKVRGLVKHFALPKSGFFQPHRYVHAVDHVDLDVWRGETVGLVGESGCGKSTLARVVTRIHQPDSGEISFDGTDIAQAKQSQIRPLRKRMQMVFQDPYASLNPRMSVADILGEPLRFHGLTTTNAETRERIQELLATVGLSPKSAERFPHEFSGGQRQRISIARALAVKPDFIVADEPISALDVNIQAQIINLMLDLQDRFGLTYLFIAHDLAVVRHISDRVVVLYLGKVMEVAPADAVFDRPLHPYTRYLISAVPIPDAAVERGRSHLKLTGEPPSAIDPPSGCRFRTRCPLAKPICVSEPPPLVEHAPNQFAACHFAGQLS
ncbi:ABC transporter ATP-binding protein [Phreatobacter stygius]|uniref:ABC transporter ATP-binding protein n=5 Tax=Pseudomonadota TaxID=1224 RepID=A0A4D7BN76_9HYPH|nr:ABC transporter ATP-binding protein [Phreatobacter stygius]